KEVCYRLHLDTKEPDLRAWAQMVDKILAPPARAGIAVVGKYTELADSYKSIHEALVHGGIAHDCGVQIDWIASDRFTDQEAAGELLGSYDGLLVPGGFGVRGVEGMLEAIRWAREHKLPFFGICLGLQSAIIEFARNVVKLPNTNSSEFEPEYGMRCSGLSPDGSLVEMIELPDHPWFIGCQFHPELRSRPMRPHPLFAGFVGAALAQHRARPVAARADTTSELARFGD